MNKKETIDNIIEEGDIYLVIRAPCIVIKSDDGQMHGLDSEGEPLVPTRKDINGNPVNLCVYFPNNRIGEIYIGDSKLEVQSKIQNAQPDFERNEINGKINNLLAENII